MKDVLAEEREADAEDYAKLMRASTFGGIAIAQTGTSIPHALSYILTYDQKIPHGKAAGYFLGRFISFADEADQKAILTAAGFASADELNAFLDRLFGEYEVPQETLQRAYDTVSANAVRMHGSRVDMDNEKLRVIVKLK